MTSLVKVMMKSRLIASSKRWYALPITPIVFSGKIEDFWANDGNALRIVIFLSGCHSSVDLSRGSECHVKSTETVFTRCWLWQKRRRRKRIASFSFLLSFGALEAGLFSKTRKRQDKYTCVYFIHLKFFRHFECYVQSESEKPWS